MFGRHQSGFQMSNIARLSGAFSISQKLRLDIVARSYRILEELCLKLSLAILVVSNFRLCYLWSNAFFKVQFWNSRIVGIEDSIDMKLKHYIDVIMTTMASQITSLAVVFSTVYSGTDQRKHQSSASLPFVRWIHRSHKRPVTPKMFPFDDVIMVMRVDDAWTTVKFVGRGCTGQWPGWIQISAYHRQV